MSRKIIGITVGSQLPKPDFAQNDPTKGDYIKNKPDISDLQSKESAIYKQPEVPENAPEGALWIDTDEESGSGGSGVSSWNDLTDKPDIPTDDHINALIDAKLGVIENGAY